jgi:hypothetical protein
MPVIDPARFFSRQKQRTAPQKTFKLPAISPETRLINPRKAIYRVTIYELCQ